MSTGRAHRPLRAGQRRVGDLGTEQYQRPDPGVQRTARPTLGQGSNLPRPVVGKVPIGFVSQMT